VRDVAALGRARLDRPRWEGVLAGAWAPHVYVFAETGDAAGGTLLRARMFAPALEIEEDPATGAAAAALAGYLARREIGDGGTIRRTIRQGIEMGRPSTLEIEAEVAGGRIAVRVGGASVLVGEEEIESPADVTPSIPPVTRPAHI
jgi:trans-2,3-dihydro-3-hydroxyanthranilate isomerase